MLKDGREAPRFRAQTQDGREIRLEDYLGRKHVVLFFFPKDGTYG